MIYCDILSNIIWHVSLSWDFALLLINIFTSLRAMLITRDYFSLRLHLDDLIQMQIAGFSNKHSIVFNSCRNVLSLNRLYAVDQHCRQQCFTNRQGEWEYYRWKDHHLSDILFLHGISLINASSLFLLSMIISLVIRKKENSDAEN